MIIGILQARLGSSRLPGKVLKPILGKPMLLRQLERLQRARMIDLLVVATTCLKEDDQIENLCNMNGISCFRGSELDLLDRYYRAAEKYNAKIIARLTGDDPLTDPDLIDRMIIELKTEGYDVITNSITPTYPEGLDVTIMRSNVLFDAWSNAILPSHREHVTPYIFGASSKYKIFNYVQNIDYSAFRWTVDHQTDFDFVEEVYKQLYLKKSDFSTEDIYKFLDLNPSLANTNSMYERNEGYLKSLKLDPKVR